MKVGRNEPCPCGSGRKYKQCCLARRETEDRLWRRLQSVLDGLLPDLREHVDRQFGGEALEDAWAAFHGHDPNRPGFDEDKRYRPLFLPWFFYDWTPAPGVPTAAASYLASARLDPLARDYLQACLAGAFSFQEVLGVEPGRALRLRDLLLDTEFEVIEHVEADDLNPGDIILGRIVRLPGLTTLGGAGWYALDTGAREPVVQLRERLVATRGALDAGSLRAAFLDLVAVYREGTADFQVEDDEGGGALALHYAIDDPGAVLDGLRDLLLGNAGPAGEEPFRDVDTDFPMLVLLLRDPAAPDDASPDARVLATVELEPDSLTLLVDSEERADLAAALVAERLGDRARLLEIAGIDSDGEELDEEELDEEELANAPQIFATVLDAMFEVWADTPHVALDGRTPRAEAESAAGRARVADLLDGLERDLEAEFPGSVQASASALRRLLGL